MTFLGLKYFKCIRIRIHLKYNVFIFEYFSKWIICIHIHDFTMYSYLITFVCIRPHV